MKRFGGSKGFSAVEIILVVLVIGLIIGAGYVLYSRQNSETNTNTTSEPATASDVQEAPEEINDTNDLNAAEEALDANDPALSDSDASQIDQELSDL